MLRIAECLALFLNDVCYESELKLQKNADESESSRKQRKRVEEA